MTLTEAQVAALQEACDASARFAASLDLPADLQPDWLPGFRAGRQRPIPRSAAGAWCDRMDPLHVIVAAAGARIVASDDPAIDEWIAP